MSNESTERILKVQNEKIESFILKFAKIGLKSQSEIGTEEILSFLDSNSKDGKFDSLLSQKLISVIEPLKYKKITVDEFIKSFLQFEEDLKNQTEEFYKKRMNEQIIYNNEEEQCRTYKQEKLNSEGISEDAKLTLEMIEIYMKQQLEPNNNLTIKIVYNNNTQEIQIENIQNYSLINRNFEFNITSTKDVIEFILQGKDRFGNVFEIGSKGLSLDEITSQGEYSVEITIPDSNDREKEVAIINAKIILFLSNFNLHEEKRKKSEQKLKKLSNAINKSNEYLKDIQEIYGNSLELADVNVSTQGDKKDNQFFKLESSTFPNYNSNKNLQIHREENIGELKHSAKTHFSQEQNKKNEEVNEINDINLIKESSNNLGFDFTENKLISVLGVICLGLSLLGGFKRPDYLNQIGGILVFFFSFLRSEYARFKPLSFLLYLVLGLIVYDIVWIFVYLGTNNIDNYTGGHENGIIRLSLFACGINIIVKIFLSFCIFIQKNLYSDENK